MLRQVRDWLQRVFATTTSRPPTPPTSEQAQRTTTAARHDRAESITALRTEIRRLQQDIKDVSDSLDGLTSVERTVDEGRLASLHRELEHKQRELNRLQARV